MNQNPDPAGTADSSPTAPPPSPGYQQSSYPYPYPPGPYPGTYPPPPPPYYGYGGYNVAPAMPKNGVGIAALVIAILALMSAFSVIGGVILGLVAILLGFIAHNRVKKGEANNGGIALAGIIIGFISVILGLAFIAIWVGIFNRVGGDDYIACLREAGQNQAKIQLCAEEFQQSVENRFSVTLTPVP